MLYTLSYAPRLRDLSRVLFCVKCVFAGGSLLCTLCCLLGYCWLKIAFLCWLPFASVALTASCSRERPLARLLMFTDPRPSPRTGRRHNYYDFAVILKIGSWESQCSFSKPFQLFKFLCLLLLGIFITSTSKGVVVELVNPLKKLHV